MRPHAPEPDPSDERAGGLPHPADIRPRAAWGKRQHDAWLQRWIQSTEDLADLQYSHRMFDALIEEIDGRDIRVGDQWLTDFASGNYLGLDLDEEIIDALPAYLARWGTHPSSARMLGSPVLYERLETELTALLGAEDTLILPSITHIHMSVIPVLSGGGTVFLDGRAHKTIYDGCTLAQARGAAVKCFGSGDLDGLAALLKRTDWRRPGLICIDGVGGMTGTEPELGTLAALAREHGVLLYVDDAHGFGVLGERTPSETSPYGARGSGVVRHAGETYENIVYVGSFARAYSSQLSFVACPSAVKQVLKTGAAPYVYSGPSSVASLATALEGLKVNDRRGDQLRGRLHALTRRVLDRVRVLGLHTDNVTGLPIIELPLTDPTDLGPVGDHLFDRGVYATMAVFPLVPRDRVGIRLQLTAAHADEHIDHLSTVLGEVADRFKIQGGPVE